MVSLLLWFCNYTLPYFQSNGEKQLSSKFLGIYTTNYHWPNFKKITLNTISFIAGVEKWKKKQPSICSLRLSISVYVCIILNHPELFSLQEYEKKVATSGFFGVCVYSFPVLFTLFYGWYKWFFLLLVIHIFQGASSPSFPLLSIKSWLD